MHNPRALKYTTEYDQMTSLLCFHSYQVSFRLCLCFHRRFLFFVSHIISSTNISYFKHHLQYCETIFPPESHIQWIPLNRTALGPIMRLVPLAGVRYILYWRVGYCICPSKFSPNTQFYWTKIHVPNVVLLSGIHCIGE